MQSRQSSILARVGIAAMLFPVQRRQWQSAPPPGDLRSAAGDAVLAAALLKKSFEYKRTYMNFTRQMIGCAALGLVLVLVSATQATASGHKGGKPWQIGDVVICFGHGTCNVL